MSAQAVIVFDAAWGFLNSEQPLHMPAQVFLRSPEHTASGQGQVLVYAASWWSAEEVLMPPPSRALAALPALKPHAVCARTYCLMHMHFVCPCLCAKSSGVRVRGKHQYG